MSSEHLVFDCDGDHRLFQSSAVDGCKPSQFLGMGQSHGWQGRSTDDRRRSWTGGDSWAVSAAARGACEWYAYPCSGLAIRANSGRGRFVRWQACDPRASIEETPSGVRPRRHPPSECLVLLAENDGHTTSQQRNRTDGKAGARMIGDPVGPGAVLGSCLLRRGSIANGMLIRAPALPSVRTPCAAGLSSGGESEEEMSLPHFRRVGWDSTSRNTPTMRKTRFPRLLPSLQSGSDSR